jgi:hypothetical protein
MFEAIEIGVVLMLSFKKQYEGTKDVYLKAGLLQLTTHLVV